MSGLLLAGHVFSHAQLHADGQIAVGYATRDLKDRFNNVDGDLEGIVDNLVHLLGVEVAILLIQRDEGEIKYSFRSRGRIDVSQVARVLSPKGGGHPKAAGASVYCSVDEAAKRAIDECARRLESIGKAAS